MFWRFDPRSLELIAEGMRDPLIFVIYIIGCLVSVYVNVKWRTRDFPEHPWTLVDDILQGSLASFSWFSVITGLIAGKFFKNIKHG